MLMMVVVMMMMRFVSMALSVNFFFVQLVLQHCFTFAASLPLAALAGKRNTLQAKK